MTCYRPGGIVLDVGCGEGIQRTNLPEVGYQAIGLEIAPEPARACRVRGHPVTIARAEILRTMVLPCTDERRAIKEVGRVLAKGGAAVPRPAGLHRPCSSEVSGTP